MPSLKPIWDHSYTFCALLALPAMPMLIGLTPGNAQAVHQILHPSGEFAARLMNVSLMITPLVMLFKEQAGRVG